MISMEEFRANFKEDKKVARHRSLSNLLRLLSKFGFSFSVLNMNYYSYLKKRENWWER